MTSVLVRIALRYLAAFLVARGILGADDGTTFASDPDIQALIEAAIGAAIGGATEIWWWWTKPSTEANQAAKAVDSGQKVTVEGPRGGKTVIEKGAAQ